MHLCSPTVALRLSVRRVRQCLTSATLQYDPIDFRYQRLFLLIFIIQIVIPAKTVIHLPSRFAILLLSCHDKTLIITCFAGMITPKLID